jgi:hypothetical protein
MGTSAYAIKPVSSQEGSHPIQLHPENPHYFLWRGKPTILITSGGGGVVLHKQLQILSDFLNAFDFIRMTPDNSIIKGGVPEKATARALVEKGRAYAIYINGGGKAQLQVDLPSGKYSAQWLNTKMGNIDKKETFDHAGGLRILESPVYEEDIALRIQCH